MRDVLAPGLALGIGELPYRGVSLSYDEFDTGAAYEDFGFSPEIGFEEGITRLRDWLEQEDGRKKAQGGERHDKGAGEGKDTGIGKRVL